MIEKKKTKFKELKFESEEFEAFIGIFDKRKSVKGTKK